VKGALLDSSEELRPVSVNRALLASPVELFARVKRAWQ
jgi:hypothetical protein